MIVVRKSLLLWALLACAGCGSNSSSTRPPPNDPPPPSDPPHPTSATIRVQLTHQSAPTTAYALDGMTVRLQPVGGGDVLTGVTDAIGVASFEVTALGDYQVVSVDGQDVTGQVVGSEGREYVKTAPLADPDPVVAHEYPVASPAVSVAALGTTNAVNAPVPRARKVTIAAAGHYSHPSDDLPEVPGASFVGRVILRNLDFGGDNNGVISMEAHFADPSISLWNRLNLYSGSGDNLSEARFYGGNPTTSQGYAASHAYAGPIAFEAPGDGNWALGVTGVAAGREVSGVAAADRSFPAFGYSGRILRPFCATGASSSVSYAFDYEFQAFTEVP
jgi:hypothetical protein